jgi:hypothetical protein
MNASKAASASFFYDFPAEHWKHLRTTDEMDKRFLLRATNSRKVRQVHSFVRPRRAILPSRPPRRGPPRAGEVKAGRICGHRKAWP